MASSKADPVPPLSFTERLLLAAVKKTYQNRSLAKTVQWLQSHVGRHWIVQVTKNLHQMHHLERVPRFGPDESFIIAANHRSFFDLYVVVANLVRLGYPQRILFPVRSTFFYDHPLGFAVNGLMSFFAMYPPMFRDPKKAALNATGLAEAAALLRQGGHLLGFHPEGTRNKGNPYNLLPMRGGLGRLVHAARVPVIPVFVNGLRVEGLGQQIIGNFDGTGVPIHTVFGAPLDLDDLLNQPASQSVYKQISNRVGAAIKALGAEERELRAAAGHPPFEG